MKVINKSFFWNIRGVAISDSQLALRDFCVNNKPNIILIAETKFNVEIMPIGYLQRYGLKFVVANDKGDRESNL